MGAGPQPEAELAEHINDLERSEDPNCIWRNYVNKQLEGSYKELFAMIDVLIMLKVRAWSRFLNGDLSRKRNWRSGYAISITLSSPTQHLRIMNEREIRRFIQHYERLTPQYAGRDARTRRYLSGAESKP